MQVDVPWAEQTPIKCRSIDPSIFESESPSSSATEKDSRIINCDFLQSLIERRPKDAQFNTPFIKMLSPMVRYSKLPFRLLCRRYGADLAFTPMLIAKDMVGYRGGRDVTVDEFSSSPEDRPLIAQLAAHDPVVGAIASERLAPFIDGVDFNCGCPQPWVVKEGIGAALSNAPEKVAELVKAARAALPADKTVSVKIRLRPNLQQTVELVRRAEKMGADWITVHGRTQDERTAAPVNLPAVRLVRSTVKIPVILNGDVNTPQEMVDFTRVTGTDGVLCARGALANPAMFAGESSLPVSVLEDYLSLALQHGGTFPMHYHHILFMLYGTVLKPDRLLYVKVKSLAGMVEYYHAHGWAVDPLARVGGSYAPIYSPSKEDRRTRELYAMPDWFKEPHVERSMSYVGAGARPRDSGKVFEGTETEEKGEVNVDAEDGDDNTWPHDPTHTKYVDEHNDWGLTDPLFDVWAAKNPSTTRKQHSSSNSSEQDASSPSTSPSASSTATYLEEGKPLRRVLCPQDPAVLALRIQRGLDAFAF